MFTSSTKVRKNLPSGSKGSIEVNHVQNCQNLMHKHYEAMINVFHFLELTSLYVILGL